MLTKEQILQADDLKTEEVDVPEWGGTVRVKTLTGIERDAFESSIYDKKQKEANLQNVRAKLCVVSIVDEKGERLFSATDVLDLGKKSASALDKIFSVAQKLNGLTQKDIDELAKNSKTGQSESSTSNSQDT